MDCLAATLFVLVSLRAKKALVGSLCLIASLSPTNSSLVWLATQRLHDFTT
jgi:hypothetical protein